MSYRIDVRGDIVDTIEISALAVGTVLREDAGSLRFLAVAAERLPRRSRIRTEAQYGDWTRGPITQDSREIITIARVP